MKTEILDSPDFLLDNCNPEVKLQDRRKFGPWSLPLTQLKSKTLARSSSSGAITIARAESAKSLSPSRISASDNIARTLTSQINVQSQSVRGQFYFATLLLLKSTASAQSFAYGQETTLTSFVQLKSTTQGHSRSGNNCIYYVNFGSQVIVQSYFAESAIAAVLYLQGKTLSRSYARADKPSIFPLAVKLTSKVIAQSKLLAAIARSFNLYTTSLVQTFSNSRETVVRALSVITNTQTKDEVRVTITRPLQSTQILVQSSSKAPQSIVLNKYSKGNSQSLLRGQEIVTRPLHSDANSPSYPNITYSKKINTNSKMIGLSVGRGGEIVTRVFNGVAESISVAQQSAGSVNRLFVSNSISISFSRTTTHITAHLYSSFYSQTYVHGTSIFVTRPLSAKGLSQNPFHGRVSKGIATQAKAAAITLSNAQEHVTRPLSAKGNSQNPFHANPNLARQLQAKMESETIGHADGIHQQFNLAAKSIAQSELRGAETVTRPLAASSLDETYSVPDISILKKVNSTVIAQSEAKGQEVIARDLSSKIIVDTESSVNISINRPLKSVSEDYSYAVAQNLQRKLNLAAKSQLVSEASGNEVISRKISSSSIDQTQGSSKSLNIKQNLYATSISISLAESQSMNKQIGFNSQVIVQTYSQGLENYLGNKRSEVGYAEKIGQGVINLAPFNYPDQKDI